MLNIFKKRETKTINDNSDTKVAEFIRKSKKKKVGLKSALIEYSAKERGLEVERLSNRILTIKGKKSESIAFVHMNGPSSSRVSMSICDNKIFTRRLLSNNEIVVVESKDFKYDDIEKATQYFNKLNCKCVLKPISLSRGRGITTNITNEAQLRVAWEKAFKAYKTKIKSRKVVLEKQVEGFDYRVFVIKDKVISVTQRKRANVLGDGQSTILELINLKNKVRSQNPYLEDHLIPTDITLLDVLQINNMSLDYIPKKGEEITLRSQSNISAGE